MALADLSLGIRRTLSGSALTAHRTGERALTVGEVSSSPARPTVLRRGVASGNIQRDPEVLVPRDREGCSHRTIGLE